MMKQFAALVFIVTILSGCSKDSDCSLSASETTEMVVLGATFVSYCEYTPDQIVVSTVGDNEIYVEANMTLFFTPHPDYEVVDFENHDSSIEITDRYQYSYSQLQDGRFIEIPATGTLENEVSIRDQYSSRVSLNEATSGLAVVGNHYISTYIGGFATIPVRATHTELWFYDQSGSTRELVRRVPLESLNVWKRYIKPVVDGDISI